MEGLPTVEVDLTSGLVAEKVYSQRLKSAEIARRTCRRSLEDSYKDVTRNCVQGSSRIVACSFRERRKRPETVNFAKMM